MTAKRGTILLLAAALAVDYADRSVVGAVGPQLKAYFHIGNAGLGVVASAFAVTGALAAVPAGSLVDGRDRVRLLRLALLLWAVAMVAGGGAVYLWWLIAARVVLGALAAVARPAAASLIGDLYRTSERSRAMGAVDVGELVGTGLGLLIAAAGATFLGWRGVFWILAAAGAVLALVARRVREPRRRRRSRHVPLVEAFREVLRSRTIVVVIVANSVGYFFFAGVRTFAVTFAAKHYGVSERVADLLVVLLGVGAIAGLLLGGRIGDRLATSGPTSRRLVFAAGAFVAAVVLYAGALVVPSLALAMPLYIVGSGALTLATPVLDAIRIDVMPPDLWGRAEAVRTTTQVVLEAVAPLAFGLVADALGGDGRGLQLAFLAVLPLLLGNGLILLLARGPLERECRS